MKKVTISDSYNTYDLDHVILPVVSKWNLSEFIKTFNAKNVQPGFSYNSGTNNNWETNVHSRN